MHRKQIIIFVVAIIMLLFNVIGTITVVAAGIVNDRDIVGECLTSVIHIEPKPTETWVVEEWTLPIKNPQSENLLPTEPVAE